MSIDSSLDVLEKTLTTHAPDVVSSAAKTLALLSAFCQSDHPLGLSELALIANIPKSTGFRLLASLEQAGFVERVGRRYRLTPRLIELAGSTELGRGSGLGEEALPYLTDLYSATGRAVHLAVLDGNDVLYVNKIQGSRSLRLPTRIGGRMPAHSSGLGKAMLAFGGAERARSFLQTPLQARTKYTITSAHVLAGQLDKVRAEGVAFDREEATLGLTCVAAPVVVNGRAVAAISVSSPTGGFSAERYIPLVKRAAQAIASSMEHSRV